LVVVVVDSITTGGGVTRGGVTVNAAGWTGEGVTVKAEPWTEGGWTRSGGTEMAGTSTVIAAPCVDHRAIGVNKRTKE
jgi:hypothetical protein